jgi:hypothetical protein
MKILFVTVSRNAIHPPMAIDAELGIVEVVIVSRDTEHGQCHLTRQKDIALGDRTGREPAITKEFGSNYSGTGKLNGLIHVKIAAPGGLGAVQGVTDQRASRRILGYRECERD